MLKLIRTDNTNVDFLSLVNLLDTNLKVTDGDEHDFYNQFNGVENIKFVIVAYLNDKLVGCGAIKHNQHKIMEVKRMFVSEVHRGKGIATQILKALELWAFELGYEKCILETGNRQKSAIALYEKNGYQVIDNYDQYIGVVNSVCFGKVL